MEKTKKTMPTDLDDYIGLRCPICMNPAKNPHITSCCRSVFCGTHADLDLYDNGCPLCRRTAFSFEYSLQHQRWIDKYTLKCECSEPIFLADYQKHIERCSKPTFPCPHDACKKKGETTMYNSKELAVHLAEAHCKEVSICGTNYVTASSVESDKANSKKYVELSRRLTSIIYPKMIRLRQDVDGEAQNSSSFLCPRGHRLIHASPAQRKQQGQIPYISRAFCCDVCESSFAGGKSWHCSCSDSGFDMCDLCLVSKLYDLNDQSLTDAQQFGAEERRNFRASSQFDPAPERFSVLPHRMVLR